MNFNEYTVLALRTAHYPRETAKEYCILGLTGEAGEVANNYKKTLRDGTDKTAAIKDELGDVLWYVALIAWEFGWTLEEVARDNVAKLALRHQPKI